MKTFQPGKVHSSFLRVRRSRGGKKCSCHSKNSRSRVRGDSEAAGRNQVLDAEDHGEAVLAGDGVKSLAKDLSGIGEGAGRGAEANVADIPLAHCRRLHHHGKVVVGNEGLGGHELGHSRGDQRIDGLEGWARSKVGNGAVVGGTEGISRKAGAESVNENTSFTPGSSQLAGDSRKPAWTGAGEKLVGSSRAGTTILAGVAGAVVASIGARVVGENGGPRGVVCHGAEIVSTAEQGDRLKTRGMELGGNGSNEFIAVERPEKNKPYCNTKAEKKRNLRVGYAQHLEGRQKPEFNRNGPGKVVALEGPREEKKKRKEKKRKEKL